MGQTLRQRLIILSVILALIGMISGWIQIVSPKRFEPSNDLDEALAEIPNWENLYAISLEPIIIEALELDDYIDFVYSNINGEISLYIGQYFSNHQIGAAHDPLVCYPGQGWKVSHRKKDKIYITANNQEYKISYSSMVTERNDQTSLVLYWFQSYDTAHADTLSQKFSSLWDRITGRSQANALVRINTTLENKNEKRGKQLILQFITDFYPVYIKYLTPQPIIKQNPEAPR